MIGPVIVDVKRLVDGIVSGAHPEVAAASRRAERGGGAGVALRRRTSGLLRRVADRVEPAA